MKKIIFAICEGAHDVAFLYRLFLTQGFETYKEIIKEFPPPMDKFILGTLKDSNYENMKLVEVRQKAIPDEILFKEQTLVMFFAIGGDSCKKKRKDLISKIQSFKPDDQGAKAFEKGLDYSFIYFFDANAKGVEKRLEEVEQEIKETFNVDSVKISHAGEPLIIRGFRVGCYIFSDNDKYGKLEDVMIPMMEKGNEEIFQKAGEYLELRDETRLKKLELKRNDLGDLVEARTGDKMKFDDKKAKICIAGQLQNSGKSNVVIIKDCDYINLEKIQSSSQCREIMEFIHSMIS